MDAKYRNLVERAEEEGAYEWPSDFDYDSLEKSAKKVDIRFQSELGLTTKFEGMNHNQDASFSVSIELVDFAVSERKTTCIPTIRFSNFGKLVSL